MAKTHERQLAKEPTAAQRRAALAARLMAERIRASEARAAEHRALGHDEAVKFTHWSNLPNGGQQPGCADRDGFLAYRPAVVEALERGEAAEATPAERYVAGVQPDED